MRLLALQLVQEAGKMVSQGISSHTFVSGATKNLGQSLARIDILYRTLHVVQVNPMLSVHKITSLACSRKKSIS